MELVVAAPGELGEGAEGVAGGASGNRHGAMKVLAELPLPIGGLMSDDDPGVVAAKIRTLDKVAIERRPPPGLSLPFDRAAA